ncbi:unnamed protein product [Effrenium voratum]|nr:unnamed protein product [Effrenium voratum]
MELAERKRPADGDGNRHSKRRRLGQASILCMRELFRTVVNDGDISEDNRILLQNAGVLLSQVDGQTWVSFPDTQGELKELTPQQLRHLRPFLDQVAEELKKHEVQVFSESAGSDFDCLELAQVPWADGITARELIACCSPDEELHLTSKWLEVALRILPSKYMLKSRVRELINYHYLRSFSPKASTAPDASPLQRLAKAPGCGALRRACGTVATCGRCSCRAGRVVASSFSTAVAGAVVCFAALLAAALGQLMRLLPFRDDPAWPLARLFFAVLLQGQIRKFLELIVLIARLRVILCLARSSEFFGFLFFPFVVIAKKVLGWNEGSWLLGCSCESSRPSLLSWCPVRAAEGLLVCLKAVQYVPTMPGLGFLSIIVDPVVNALDFIEPAVVFISDLIFSVGFAEGLASIVRSVDTKAHHKLVWMSMNVGRVLREGPRTPTADATPVAVPEVQADSSLPAWREDGTWNLFDGAG